EAEVAVFSDPDWLECPCPRRPADCVGVDTDQARGFARPDQPPFAGECAHSPKATTGLPPGRFAPVRARIRGHIRDTSGLAAPPRPRKTPVFRGFPKRMMGLEPTTFCMARTRREATGGDWSRQLGSVARIWLRRGDTR